jgi:oxygen-independent coproporphyrinogen-3 oxidase
MAGVYISYPFCAQKCSYCNFASGVFPKSAELVYQNKLRDEIASQTWPWIPETLYLGGGTPSLWPLDDLAAVLALIPGRPWTEATMEAAPGSLTPEKVAAWVKLGINRVSLGVQSMVEPEIRKTGRKHTAAIVRDDVSLLRQSGIEAINIDLIAGLALQTKQTWEQSLEAVLALQVPHLSIYLLEVDEDSRLGAEVLLNGKRYGAPEVPSEEAQAEMYQRAVDRLADLGIERYEISNFARPGWESRHNLKYWRLEPYLGFGADAHSFDGQWRWQNSDNVVDYKKSPAESADSEREKYWVGLRLSAGVPIEPHWQPTAERLAAAGLLEWRHGKARLTDRGVLLSNEVFQEFIRE